MKDMAEVKSLIVNIVSEGGVSTRYSGESIVDKVSWIDNIGSERARKALRELLTEGTLCYTGKWSMLAINQEGAHHGRSQGLGQ